MAIGKYQDIIKREVKPYIDAIKDDFEARKNKDYFRPNGTQMYTGMQGSGKTISAVKHLLSLKELYPKSIIVSNLKLNKLTPKPFNTKEQLLSILQDINPQKEYIIFSSIDELAIALTSVNNGIYGVAYIIDEIHTYFNALDSKNIPIWVFTEISQQRKQRKLIIGTSQLFMRTAKPLREQCNVVVVCKTAFGILTTQTAFNAQIDIDESGKIIGHPLKKGFFFQSRYLRNAFDTFQKVQSGEQQFEQQPRYIQVQQPKRPLLSKR